MLIKSKDTAVIRVSLPCNAGCAGCNTCAAVDSICEISGAMISDAR